MEKTIFGVFDNPNDIQPTIADLTAQGVDRNLIQVIDSAAGTNLSLPDEELETNAKPGLWAGFKHWLHSWDLGTDDSKYFAEAVRRGGTLLAVRIPDNATIADDQVTDILCAHGAIDIDHRADYYRKEGFTDFDENAAPYGRDEMIAERERFAPGGKFAIPVAKEDLKVGKRRIEKGRVRVVSRVIEEPVEKRVNLRNENVEVERRATDRPLGADELEAMKDQTLEFTESTEEPIVQKEARVTEEVLVNKNAEERTEVVRDTARRTDVKVERDRGPNRRV